MRLMRRGACLLVAAALCGPVAWGAGEVEEEPKLLGRCTEHQLRDEPYAGWFVDGYDAYEPNPEVLARLRDAAFGGVEISVFFGTWCPDSQREVPRLVRLLREMGFPESHLHLVALDNEEGSKKRSPGGEEAGRGIYRIPTVLIFRDGRELARMVEHPVLSLERDLLGILSGEPYEPAYTSYPTIGHWLEQGLLSDRNISPRGLAGQVRPLVRSEGELAAAAAVLLSRGEVREAIMLSRVNCALYPQSAGAYAGLAGALVKAGEADEAREAAERALRLNTDPSRVGELVDLLAQVAERTLAHGEESAEDR